MCVLGMRCDVLAVTVVTSEAFYGRVSFDEGCGYLTGTRSREEPKDKIQKRLYLQEDGTWFIMLCCLQVPFHA